MALTGTYLRAMDDKRRIAIPKRLRDDYAESNLESLIIAPGTERSLVLYSPNGFEALGQKLADKAGHQSYLRLFYSTAERVDFDSQGRVRIPDRLAEFAGLSKEAYLLGVQDHAELWDKGIWEEFLQKNTPNFDLLAKEVFAN